MPQAGAGGGGAMTRRVFVLLGHDPPFGTAIAPAGILALEAGEHALSWLPYAEAAEQWRQRLAGTTVDLAEAVETWLELADGVVWDLVELAPAGTADLRGDVEVAMDALLGMGGDEV